MISTRIRGGLGNQLFQYCAGRALALRLGVPLSLDLRDFDGANARRVGLNHFDIATVPAERLPAARADGVRRAVGKLLRGGNLRGYREKTLAYDLNFEFLGDDTLLKGYWQSERYFQGFETQIRRDLQIVTPASAQNLAMLEDIGGGLAVSLHIRRGDYVSNEKYNAAHGISDLDYYARAAAFVAERLGAKPVFYAFSDDPDWVRDHLKLPFEVRVVDHNGDGANYEDLRLMAACQHHIVANSSFSWWGAWLNPGRQKLVVAPTRWFADPKTDNPDIVPADWHRV
jgi:hypothetical protein